MVVRRHESFDFRMRLLGKMIGLGDLTGRVKVDQVYAQNQHESLDFKHPHGGRAKYLEGPLFENARGYLEDIADGILKDGGREAMIDAMQDLAGNGGVMTHAPLMFGDLRRSGHATVEDRGVVIFDEPPLAHRLSDEELKQKGRLARALGIEYSYGP